jgi:cysteine desulfurase / selenocysteine lyase
MAPCRIESVVYLSTNAGYLNPMNKLDYFKAQFHSAGPVIHMNNAGITPLPKPTKASILEWLQLFEEDAAACGPKFAPAIYATMDELAKFLNADSKQISIQPNTASGISQIAFGYPLKAGDEIITWDQEYPSNFYPWKVACERTGAKLVLAKSGPNQETPVETLIQLMTPKTKIIAFSFVQYRNGAIADIEAITSYVKGKNIFVCADIIQGAGLLPFDFKKSGLDAACGGSHKWLCGTSSTGYMILKPKHIEKINPTLVGAMSFGTWDDLSDPKKSINPDMSKFSHGAKSFLDTISFRASLKLLNDTGIEVINKETERLSLKLKNGLLDLKYAVPSPHGAGHRGSIVNFTPTSSSPLKDIPQIDAALEKAKITYAKRPPGVRLSPHAFNTDANIDYVLKTLS